MSIWDIHARQLLETCSDALLLHTLERFAHDMIYAFGMEFVSGDKSRLSALGCGSLYSRVWAPNRLLCLFPIELLQIKEAT